ncbi:Phosphotransferase enzyme family protein [Pyrenophora tritici-repentis]|nr:Phosphotransferase enzyme family protein [Pyrenophora tritici-repentis]KAI2480264.1 Phosphotransferase enzyme family protein [Pyrenophora tritici-repentis]
MKSRIAPFRRAIPPLFTQPKSISDSFRSLGSTSAKSQVNIRGAIDQYQHLFEYTSGRWLYNEHVRLAERRLSFNVDELKKAAASSINKSESDVKSIQKLAEGGFNRVFEIGMIDGTSVLARLPYPFTQPRRLAVASEVATMNFVRAHGVPTPRTLGYAIHENLVGSEYILMEKLSGRPLGDKWFDLSKQQRLQILYDIVKLESLLFSIQLPASGSIYYAHDLNSETLKVEVPGTDGQFCVGPYVGLRWWYGKRGNLTLDRGPRKYP